MKAGDVVLARLPQADQAAKLRPALVLCRVPPFADLLLCGISTQMDRAVDGFDEVIGSSDPDFQQSGLRAASVVRLGLLATRPVALVGGVLGRIDPGRLARRRRAVFGGGRLGVLGRIDPGRLARLRGNLAGLLQQPPHV